MTERRGRGRLEGDGGETGSGRTGDRGRSAAGGGGGEWGRSEWKGNLSQASFGLSGGVDAAVRSHRNWE